MSEAVKKEKARRTLEPKHFLPDADVIKKEIIGKDKGTRLLVGRIYGVATGSDVRISADREGNDVSSTVITGVFNAENPSLKADDKNKTNVGVTSVYFPGGYANILSDRLEAGALVLSQDVDIFLESNGKKGFSWVVVPALDEKSEDVLATLANRPKKGK